MPAGATEKEKLIVASSVQHTKSLAPPSSAGDKDAMQEFDLEIAIRDHSSTIASLVHRLVDNPSDVSDLVQDVYVIAVEKQHQFRGDATISTWLCGIAIRVCRRWYRQKSLRQKYLMVMGLRHVEEDTSHETSMDRADLLESALRQMPLKEREVLVLRYLQQREIDEISKLLNLSHSAAEKRLSRGRQRLATLVNRLSGEQS